MNKVKIAFLKAYKSGNKMDLMQKIYLILAVAFVFLAGLVALLNQAAGIGLLIVPLVAFTAWSVNMVAWSVVKSIAESLIDAENGIKRELEISFGIERTPKKKEAAKAKVSSAKTTDEKKKAKKK